MKNRGLYKVIRRKSRASWKADRQLCTGIFGPQVAAIVHSTISKLLSTYLRSLYPHMYMYTVREFLWCHTLHNFSFVHDISCAITSAPPKSEKKILVAKSTVFAWHLATLGDT